MADDHDQVVERAEAEADRVAKSWSGTVKTVRADSGLTDSGKAERLSEAYDMTVAKLQALGASVEASAAARQSALERLLCGPKVPYAASPGDEMAIRTSFRDAVDRANAASGRQLATLVDQAVLTGDRVLARGALSVAIARRDVPAMNSYVAAFPDERADLDELFDLRDVAQSPQARVTRSMRYGAPAMPDEVRRHQVAGRVRAMDGGAR